MLEHIESDAEIYGLWLKQGTQGVADRVNLGPGNASCSQDFWERLSIGIDGTLFVRPCGKRHNSKPYFQDPAARESYGSGAAGPGVKVMSCRNIQTSELRGTPALPSRTP